MKAKILGVGHIDPISQSPVGWIFEGCEGCAAFDLDTVDGELVIVRYAGYTLEELEEICRVSGSYTRWLM